MIVEETFYRPAEIGRETRRVPADVYNLARLLLARNPGDCLFVPIRSMQYLAVLDAEEYVFIHREGQRMIELAWQRFLPKQRATLAEPVSYEVVYYTASGAEIMRRLQPEFRKALEELHARQTPAGRTARVIKLPVGGD